MLQNLLSDDECSGAEDIDSAAAFDSDHFEPNVVEEVPRVTPRKRRVSYYCGPYIYFPLVVFVVAFYFA